MFKDLHFIQFRACWGRASKCTSTQIYRSLSCCCCSGRVLSETSRLCKTWVALNFWAGLLFQAATGCSIWGWGGGVCRSRDVQMQACLRSEEGCLPVTHGCKDAKFFSSYIVIRWKRFIYFHQQETKRWKTESCKTQVPGLSLMTSFKPLLIL